MNRLTFLILLMLVLLAFGGTYFLPFPDLAGESQGGE